MHFGFFYEVEKIRILEFENENLRCKNWNLEFEIWNFLSYSHF